MATRIGTTIRTPRGMAYSPTGLWRQKADPKHYGRIVRVRPDGSVQVLYEDTGWLMEHTNPQLELEPVPQEDL